ncbi:MAG: AbiJ-NTD4 domain-containing protein [Pyrinomonadaceae bacterium]
MRFSERKGYKEVSKIIQIDSISSNLRNLIWNALHVYIWDEGTLESNYRPFFTQLRHHYFKQRIDNISYYQYHNFLHDVREYFFKAEWYEVYDFLEEILYHFKNDELNQLINNILEQELSAYRFVSGIFTDITNTQEIEMLKDALTDVDFPNVKAHLQRALELLSDRKSPDYRNSIKESISAVESIAREIANNPKATLGEALKEIEKKGDFHKALKEGFLKLYGYTSDANGIRHAMMDEPNLTANDAKFFLLVCTSFINYLKTKM